MTEILIFAHRTWGINTAIAIHELSQRKKNFVIRDIIIPNTSDNETRSVSISTVSSLVAANEVEYDESLRNKLCLFIGWSWKVPSDFIAKNTCICFHPSDLPKYAGGSPIQNQIFDGIYDTKLTAFQMTDILDQGPIYAKANLSLFGGVDEIFLRLQSLTYSLSEQIISDFVAGELILSPSVITAPTVHKRRTPADSLISVDELKILRYNVFYQRVKALTAPYPNLFIEGLKTRILIEDVMRCEQISGTLIRSDNQNYELGARYFVQLADCYAEITSFKILTHD